MGRWVKRIILALLIFLVVAQLIPLNRDNPDVDPKKTIYAKETVPDSLKIVFDRSCGDCHSNHTTWPWYSYVAPVSWVVVSDVHDGRKEMNFSEWGDYSPSDKEKKLEHICEQVTQGDMPDKKYVLLHRDARLRTSERDAICRWTEALRKY